MQASAQKATGAEVQQKDAEATGAIDRFAAFVRLRVQRKPARSEADWALVEREVIFAFKGLRARLPGRLERLIERHGSEVATRVFAFETPLASGRTVAERCVFDDEHEAFDALLPHIKGHPADEMGATLLLRALDRGNAACARKLLPVADLAAKMRQHERGQPVGAFDLAAQWVLHPTGALQGTGGEMLADLAVESARRPREEAAPLLEAAFIALARLVSQPHKRTPFVEKPSFRTVQMLRDSGCLERAMGAISSGVDLAEILERRAASVSEGAREVMAPWIEAAELRRAAAAGAASSAGDEARQRRAPQRI
jgi:hypothetical protein